MDEDSYIRGQEDAFDLCLSEMENLKTLQEAKQKIQEYLATIKEAKLEKLKERYFIFDKN